MVARGTKVTTDSLVIMETMVNKIPWLLLLRRRTGSVSPRRYFLSYSGCFLYLCPKPGPTRTTLKSQITFTNTLYLTNFIRINSSKFQEPVAFRKFWETICFRWPSQAANQSEYHTCNQFTRDLTICPPRSGSPCSNFARSRFTQWR